MSEYNLEKSLIELILIGEKKTKGIRRIRNCIQNWMRFLDKWLDKDNFRMQDCNNMYH